MRTATLIIPTILVGAAVVAGCGGNPPVAASESPPPAETPAEQTSPTTAAYDSIQALRDGVESSGNVCTAWNVVDEGDPIEAVCTSDMHLFAFEDEQGVQDYVDELAAFPVEMFGRSDHWLVGPSWAISCGEDRATCEDLEAALGGRLRIYEP